MGADGVDPSLELTDRGFLLCSVRFKPFCCCYACYPSFAFPTFTDHLLKLEGCAADNLVIDLDVDAIGAHSERTRI